ncbi:acyl-CoA dehydrogenase family protein [Nonomuraea sp. NPDC050556]|uniref:acyl-CoA dehydrogenase family protein n=1 Tax=Nonomuraea sp. NPDC050556 TaxID=3364369 RepID=UPI0037967DF1
MNPLLPLLPSDEEREIRDAVRAICAKFDDGYARRKHAAGEPPTELWQELSAAGYIGIRVPEEWGGGGAGVTELAMVVEEVAAATGTLPVMLVVSAAIAGPLLSAHGSAEQKERWLRGIAAGTTKMAFALTEPDAGSNSHELRTELRRDGDGYRLSGQKVFISGVEDADAVLVVARMRSQDGSLGKPTLVVVDVDAPGFTRQPIAMQYIGPEQQWQLFFDDMDVGADRLIGGENGGLRALFDGLNPERIIGAAMACGLARRAIDRAAAYARERAVWGVPIGAHQGIAHPLAAAKISLDLAKLMTQKAAALQDAGAAEAGDAANIAKYAAAEAALQAIDQAIQTHGGNGLTLEYGVSDLWFLARLARVAPVSREMILNHVAHHTLGLPRSY